MTYRIAGLIIAQFTIASFSLSAQTLVVPGGAVGSSGNGNVGVGLVSPQQKLAVGVADSTPSASAANSIAAVGASGKITAIGANATYGWLQSYNGPLYINDAGNNIVLNGGGYGNVGVGIGSPQQKLAVGVADSPPSTSAANSIAAVGASGKITAIGANATYGWLQSYNGPLYINEAGKNIVLNGGGSGNVGIGTSSPTQKLSVNGTIRAKEVIVETTGWSDYVLAKGYDLAPLSEVEQQIESKGHLPGIPSAQEVAESGIRMGDMQARLLAKVEELTLHLIAQDKRLSDATSRISRLEAENAQLRATR